MTSHLDDGVLNALLDGEIPSSEIAPLQTHLDACDTCRARLEEARGFREEALALIEVLDTAVEPPGGTPVVPLRSTRRGRSARRWVTGLAWAASIALAVSAGFLVAGRRVDRPSSEALAAAPAEGAADATEQSTANPMGALVADSAARVVAARPVPPATQATAGRTAERQVPVDPAKPGAADERARKDEVANARAEPESPEAARESRAAAPPPAAEADAAKRAGKVVAPDAAGRRSQAQEAPAPVAAFRAAQPADRPVTAMGAIEVLGGSLALIDGLVPERIAVVGDTVQVVYPTPFGLLVLEQWREAGTLRTRLVPPSTAPADSVESWRRRTTGARRP